MAVHDVEQAITKPDPPKAAPTRHNSVLARMSRPPRTQINGLLVWAFLASVLLAAAVLAAAAYWGYRQIQPPALFAPAPPEQSRPAQAVPTANPVSPNASGRLRVA